MEGGSTPEDEVVHNSDPTLESRILDVQTVLREEAEKALEEAKSATGSDADWVTVVAQAIAIAASGVVAAAIATAAAVTTAVAAGAAVFVATSTGVVAAAVDAIGRFFGGLFGGKKGDRTWPEGPTGGGGPTRDTENVR